MKYGVSILLYNKNTCKFLVGLRKSKHGYETLANPGGHIESHELENIDDNNYTYVILEAGKRELLEETGLEINQCNHQYLGKTLDVFDEDKIYETHHYLVYTDIIDNVLGQELDKCELWFWISYNELLDCPKKKLFLPLYNIFFNNLFSISDKSPLEKQVILFHGPPGVGKGTQGKILSEKYNLIHLSTGELYRKEVLTGSERGIIFKKYMDVGEIIPEQYTFEYLTDEISKLKYQQGFILDGYPKDTNCYNFIISMFKLYDITINCVIDFHIDKSNSNILVNRLNNRLICPKCDKNYNKDSNKSKCTTCFDSILIKRDDDIESSICKRLDVYENNKLPLLDLYIDNNLLYRVDATLNVELVTYNILNILEYTLAKDKFIGNMITQNKFQILNDEHMSIYHFHIDAKESSTVRYLCNQVSFEIPHIPIKIYNIDSLKLLSQYSNPNYEKVYSNMKNFKSIQDTNQESFATGFLGKKLDYSIIDSCIVQLKEYKNKEIMFELEETIYSAEVNSEGHFIERLNLGFTTSKFTVEKLLFHEPCSSIKNLPFFELHHGIDILKSDQNSDISSVFKEFFEKESFNIGGLFIFSNDKYWQYRTNEFSYESDYNKVLNRLKEQSEKLKHYCSTLNIKFSVKLSLEKVHMICSF